MEKNWFKNETGEYECKICHKTSKSGSGMGNHVKYHQGYTGPTGGKASWNRGLKKESSESMQKVSETAKRRIKEGRIPNRTGTSQSKETKEKISKGMRKYLEEHPDQVPYLLNHYSKGPSYPEVYWIDLIRNENLDLSYHKQIGLYELDFFNEAKHIDLEIDGEQHHTDPRIVDSDIRRTAYLESLGWMVIRVRWKEWQTKTIDEKQAFVEYLKSLL